MVCRTVPRYRTDAGVTVVHALRRSDIAAKMASAQLALRDYGRFTLIVCWNCDGKLRLPTGDDELIPAVVVVRARVSYAAPVFLRATVAMTRQPDPVYQETD